MRNPTNIMSIPALDTISTWNVESTATTLSPFYQLPAGRGGGLFHVYMYACMHVCIHVCMYACMHVCIHVCMDAFMHVCVSLRSVLR